MIRSIPRREAASRLVALALALLPLLLAACKGSGGGSGY
jgi:hypothetical protein